MRYQRCMTILYASSFLLPAILATESRADLYGFAALSNNSGQSGSLGPQLLVDVAGSANNQVRFTFYNNLAAPYTGSIKGVFFDEETLLGRVTLGEPPGVNFDVDGKPRNFPEGNTLTPSFETTFSARKTGAAAYGVDPGESLAVVFDLNNGKTFSDVLDAIQWGFATGGAGGLRVGIHVGSIGTDDSERFVRHDTRPGGGNPWSVRSGRRGHETAPIRIRLRDAWVLSSRNWGDRAGRR